MHMYNVKKGTKAKLLIQEPNVDIVVRDDFVTQYNSCFGDEHLVIDFVRFKNSGKPANSIATRLAAKGYYIFCQNTPNDNHLLAVHASNVEVL